MCQPSATTKWISLKALILMPSDKQVLIIVDDKCDLRVVLELLK